MSEPRPGSALPSWLLPLIFAVLLVATAGAIAYIQDERARPIVVDQPEVRRVKALLPAYSIRFRLTQRSADAAIEIVDEEGDAVTTLLGGAELNGYFCHELRWNMRRTDGTPVRRGTYFVRVVLTDQGREITLSKELIVRRRDEISTGDPGELIDSVRGNCDPEADG